MLSSERRRRILEWLQRESGMTVAELSQRLDVSASTIRRDLTRLAQEGWLEKIHGGATLPLSVATEPPTKLQRLRNVEEKRRIGMLAATLVNPGEVVFLDAGTTTLEVAKNLKRISPLTVVTNDILIAAELLESRVEIIVTGGSLHKATVTLTGPLTDRVVGELHVDKVFAAISALSIEHGLTTAVVSEAFTKRAILAAGREVIGVADHSKFGQVAFVAVAPLTALHRLVTDEGTPAADIQRLRELGIEVLLA